MNFLSNLRIKLFLLPLLALTVVTACEPDEDGNNGLSNEEIVAGLKAALEVGTDTSVAILHKTDGYYLDDAVKILLPPEADVIFDNIASIPGGNLLVENTIKTINRAAEDAASEATPIFVDAIRGMTISDGVDILFGTDTAATHFLRVNTYSGLQGAFQPKIETSLNKDIILGVSAEDSYQSLVNTYNTASLNGLLFPKVTENTLSEYTTRRALNGLFLKVSDEEKKIRLDPIHRVSDILVKVFGELD